MNTNTNTPADQVAQTPAAKWRAEGQPDPHGTQYDCERAALTLGDLTDDELANGAFMNYDQRLDIEAVMSKRADYHPAIVWMTAVKERIRWLSRSLEAARAALPAQAGPTVKEQIQAAAVQILRDAQRPDDIEDADDNGQADALAAPVQDVAPTLFPPLSPDQTGVGEWCAPGPAGQQERRWLIRFEDTEKGEMVFTDEATARAKFAAVEINWTAHLFEHARRVAPPAVAKDVAPSDAQPLFYINPKIIDPATGKLADHVRTAITWSDKPLSGWSMPVFAAQLSGNPGQLAAQPADALAREVEIMVSMIEEKEWAEHVGKTPLGQRLEAAITQMHSDIHDAAEDPPADAQDAARYRLVRRGQHWSVIDGIGDTLRAEALDSAVDAELDRTQEGAAS